MLEVKFLRAVIRIRFVYRKHSLGVVALVCRRLVRKYITKFHLVVAKVLAFIFYQRDNFFGILRWPWMAVRGSYKIVEFLGYFWVSWNLRKILSLEKIKPVLGFLMSFVIKFEGLFFKLLAYDLIFYRQLTF